MECALFLDIIVRQSATIFQLFTGKDQPLLIWRNSLLVLDLGLDVLNGVGWLNLQGDSLACQGLDKDLHASPESENKMECALFLDIIVRQSATIFQLFTGEDQPLLIWGNSLLVLDLGLDVLNGVCSLSGYYSQTECDHLPAVYRRRSTSADLGEFPPCLTQNHHLILLQFLVLKV